MVYLGIARLVGWAFRTRLIGGSAVVVAEQEIGHIVSGTACDCGATDVVGDDGAWS